MTWTVQRPTWTANNRYPGIFRTIQARIAETRGAELGGAALRILSFGCSTGSEALALRAYFPEATIFACDVNTEILAEASASLANDEAVVFESSPHAIRTHGPYDIIFAMSVLCRFPESRDQQVDFAELYSFSQFEDAVGLLTGCLAAGGILCLYNSSYEFAASSPSRHFRPVRSPLFTGNGFVDRFAPSGARRTICESRGPYFVHRICANASDTETWDFRDCIFEAASPGSEGVTVAAFPTNPAPAEVPHLMRFGPDLQQSAAEQVIAAALGYWFTATPGGHTLTRAWFRTTPSGKITRGSAWSVACDVDARQRLVAAPWRPSGDLPSSRRVKSMLRAAVSTLGRRAGRS